jgi:hypothetical protein
MPQEDLSPNPCRLHNFCRVGGVEWGPANRVSHALAWFCGSIQHHQFRALHPAGLSHPGLLRQVGGGTRNLGRHCRPHPRYHPTGMCNTPLRMQTQYPSLRPGTSTWSRNHSHPRGISWATVRQYQGLGVLVGETSCSVNAAERTKTQI